MYIIVVMFSFVNEAPWRQDNKPKTKLTLVASSSLCGHHSFVVIKKKGLFDDRPVEISVNTPQDIQLDHVLSIIMVTSPPLTFPSPQKNNIYTF